MQSQQILNQNPKDENLLVPASVAPILAEEDELYYKNHFSKVIEYFSEQFELYQKDTEDFFELATPYEFNSDEFNKTHKNFINQFLISLDADDCPIQFPYENCSVFFRRLDGFFTKLLDEVQNELLPYKNLNSELPKQLQRKIKISTNAINMFFYIAFFHLFEPINNETLFFKLDKVKLDLYFYNQPELVKVKREEIESSCGFVEGWDDEDNRQIIFHYFFQTLYVVTKLQKKINAINESLIHHYKYDFDDHIPFENNQFIKDKLCGLNYRGQNFTLLSIFFNTGSGQDDEEYLFPEESELERAAANLVCEFYEMQCNDVSYSKHFFSAQFNLNFEKIFFRCMAENFSLDYFAEAGFNVKTFIQMCSNFSDLQNFETDADILSVEDIDNIEKVLSDFLNEETDTLQFNESLNQKFSPIAFQVSELRLKRLLDKYKEKFPNEQLAAKNKNDPDNNSKEEVGVYPFTLSKPNAELIKGREDIYRALIKHYRLSSMNQFKIILDDDHKKVLQFGAEFINELSNKTYTKFSPHFLDQMYEAIFENLKDFLFNLTEDQILSKDQMTYERICELRDAISAFIKVCYFIIYANNPNPECRDFLNQQKIEWKVLDESQFDCKDAIESVLSSLETYFKLENATPDQIQTFNNNLQLSTDYQLIISNQDALSDHYPRFLFLKIFSFMKNIFEQVNFLNEWILKVTRFDLNAPAPQTMKKNYIEQNLLCIELVGLNWVTPMSFYRSTDENPHYPLNSNVWHDLAFNCKETFDDFCRHIKFANVSGAVLPFIPEELWYVNCIAYVCALYQDISSDDQIHSYGEAIKEFAFLMHFTFFENITSDEIKLLFDNAHEKYDNSFPMPQGIPNEKNYENLTKFLLAKRIVEIFQRSKIYFEQKANVLHEDKQVNMEEKAEDSEIKYEKQEMDDREMALARKNHSAKRPLDASEEKSPKKSKLKLFDTCIEQPLSPTIPPLNPDPMQEDSGTVQYPSNNMESSSPFIPKLKPDPLLEDDSNNTLRYSP